MKWYRNGIILILTVVVIVLCAMLPVITAQIGDSLADRNVVYEEMKRVQFFKELSDGERLHLLRYGSIATISEEKAKLKSEDMIEVLEAVLLPYSESPFSIGNLADYSMECTPVLYYSSTLPGLSGIFWMVDMESVDEEAGKRVSLCLDDQTNKVMLLSFECLEASCNEEALTDRLSYLCETYMGEKDFVTKEYENRFWGEINATYEEQSIDYRFGDVIYGEISLMFKVYTYGFAIYFG